MAYLFQQQALPQVRCTFIIIVYYYPLTLVFPLAAIQRMLLWPSGVLVPMKTFSRLPIRIIPITSDHNSLPQTQSLNRTGRVILEMNGAFWHTHYTILLWIKSLLDTFKPTSISSKQNLTRSPFLPFWKSISSNRVLISMVRTINQRC